MENYILGLSCYYHDSAATLLKNGEIVAAAQEERFSRKKHDSSFPTNAIEYCLKSQNIFLEDLDQIIYYEKPLLTFERLLETYLEVSPRGIRSFVVAMQVWVKEKLFLKNNLKKNIKKLKNNNSKSKNKIPELLFSEHHLSHAAAAFYPSPFNEAAILCMDGVGEWATTSAWSGSSNNIEPLWEINFPHSLGLLYSAFTYYCGFKVNSGEYKLMGLAPYGKAKYVDKIKNKLIDIKEDGTFKIDMGYFKYHRGFRMTGNKFHNLFGKKPRRPEEKLCQFHMDIAASIQSVTEEIVLKLAKSLRVETGMKNLCLAGGVALNCVANGKILNEKIFDNIWIQPAAGDAGGSLGAALALWYLENGNDRKINNSDMMKGSYLGNEYSQVEIESELKQIGANYETFDYESILNKTSDFLMKDKAIGWFQGRMEFGPRALGGRSILADPRSDSMQKNLNLKVKYRESFRPFAPSILEEDLSNWFDIDVESPYMLLVANLKSEKKVEMTNEQKNLFGIDKLNIKRSEIPAVTHVDYTARIQTVNKKRNRIYYDLINKFKEKSGCPILVNTSFNVRGEPIVNTPKDAFNCFMGTDLDYLVIGNCILDKNKQNLKLKRDYKDKFELD